MAAEDKHLHAGVNARPNESEPLFTEEAEEEARPVVPLAGTHDDAMVVRPRRGRMPRNLVLALAVLCAGAAGAAAGYLAHTQRAQEPTTEISVGEVPEQPPPPPAPSNSQETSAAAPTVRRAQDKPQAQVEAERPGSIENEGRRRDAGERAESIREEEERLRESEKKSAERLREQEKKVAERRREDEKRMAEQRRDEEKGEKPKARLVGTIGGGRRPY